MKTEQSGPFKNMPPCVTINVRRCYGKTMSQLSGLDSLAFILSRTRRAGLPLRIKIGQSGITRTDRPLGIWMPSERQARFGKANCPTSVQGRLGEREEIENHGSLLEQRLSDAARLPSLLTAYEGLNPSGRVLPTRRQKSLRDVRGESARDSRYRR